MIELTSRQIEIIDIVNKRAPIRKRTDCRKFEPYPAYNSLGSVCFGYAQIYRRQAEGRVLPRIEIIQSSGKRLSAAGNDGQRNSKCTYSYP